MNIQIPFQNSPLREEDYGYEHEEFWTTTPWHE